MRKNSRNRPNPARRFRSPRSRVKVFDKNLVHTIIDRKHPHRSLTGFSLNLASTLYHGSCSFDLYY
jgi:hypothetical protein